MLQNPYKCSYPVTIGRLSNWLQDAHLSWATGKILGWDLSQISPSPGWVQAGLIHRTTRSNRCASPLPRPAQRHAQSLPPHRTYDCGIELLSVTTLPSSHLYNLSRPEQAAMEDYIEESLSAGIVRSSPVGAGSCLGKEGWGSLPLHQLSQSK